MEPLETNRIVLKWICIYPAVQGTSTWKKLTHFTCLLFILCYNVISIVVSINSFLETNAEDAVYTLVPLFAEIDCIFVFIATLISRSKVTAMINDLTKICKKCKFFSKYFEQNVPGFSNFKDFFRRHL